MFINSLITSILTNFQFILSMLVVVIVAACFLGRYVVLTKKLTLSSLGILVITIIANVLIALFVSEEFLTEQLLLIEQLLNLLLFAYAFFFYFFAFKEKRILRAIEATSACTWSHHTSARSRSWLWYISRAEPKKFFWISLSTNLQQAASGWRSPAWASSSPWHSSS